MSLKTVLADRFAHLRGLTPAAAAAAAEEDDMKDKREGESDEDYKSRKAKEKEEKEAATAKEREEEEARTSSKREEERKARRARKTRKAKDESKDENEEDDSGSDDEDDDDEEDEAKAAAAGHGAALDAAFRRGARGQRRRCAKIMSAPDAAKNVALAAHLAFETPLAVDAALGVLATAPAGKGALADRMGKFAVPPAQPEISPAASVAKGWERAMAPFAPKNAT